MTARRLTGRGLTARVGDRVLFRELDVTAEAGTLLAVAGPSGAGKSTLLTILAGLLRPEAGTVELDGTPISPGELALRRRMGLVVQAHGLAGALTARENVALPLQARGLSRQMVRGETDSALTDLGLTQVSAHLVDELSGGQQQRVAVARALVGAPEVVLADEPTSELDADNRERVLGLLVAAARRGAVVVVATHDPAVLDGCDRVLDLETTEGSRTLAG